MSKRPQGTVVRSADGRKLQARITFFDSAGRASRPWITLDPLLSDDEARAEAHRLTVEARRPGWTPPLPKPIADFPTFDDILSMRDPVDQRHVYFLRCKIERGPIKIGMANEVGRRIIELQTACPYDLELLGVLPGGRSVELFFHMRFSKMRTRGEWFALPALFERAIQHLLREAAHRSELGSPPNLRNVG